MMVRRSPLTRIHASRRRGFTLVELLVAMAAGLTVSMAALLFSKNATRFFQSEARVSAAHLAATLGLNRISADLQRAGFLSSPNVLRDPLVCGAPLTWPDGMRRLAGVSIRRRGSENLHPGQLGQSIANGFRPDALTVGGSFNTTEQFYFNSINCTAGGCAVNIDPYGGAVQRTLLRAAGGGDTLGEIFRAGRYLRLKLLGQNKYIYGVIQSVNINGSPVNSIVVNMENNPPLPRLVDVGDCGVRDGFSGEGGFANPVSRVRYDIRSLTGHAAYGPLVGPVSPEMTGDNGRTELVRVELDALDNEDSSTLELISEYTVDLKFGLSAATESVTPNVTNPSIQRFPITAPTENASVYTLAGDITDLGSSPQRIRSVQVRLSTRTRAPDRDVGFAAGTDGRKLRFLIPGIVSSVVTDTDPVPPNSPPVYARMRTLYADIALPNQAGVSW
jgi:prepilin-type N-terminal cleavage/methylation domain-containing protein